MKYVRDLNLNAVRLEGKIVDGNFLNLADRYGWNISSKSLAANAPVGRP